MKTPLWISFCAGVFIGFMAFLMLTVAFTMWVNLEEALISEDEMYGSLVYAGWLGFASASFLASAWCWRKPYYLPALLLTMFGFFGLFGVYAFFAEVSFALK